MALALAAGLAQPARAAQPTPETGRPHPALVGYPNRPAFELAAAGGLDIWEVRPESQQFVAALSQHEAESLLAAGFTLAPPPADLAAAPFDPPGYPCYRPISTLYSDLTALAGQYPHLTELRSIGKSYENRDIWAIRLTNEAQPGAKPRLVVMANIHGRELITPEAAMRFLERLLSGYDHDPNITWMLDWQEIYIIPSANPDGHVRNETLLNGDLAYWRKNTQPYGSCSASSYGVDLNRNHNFKWGLTGSSSYACSELYRGPQAASEPEMQAVQAYLRELFPDQRGPSDSDPAPLDTPGVFLSLHSYSDLVLWPWGFTNTPPPNSAGLSALGRKMASYNGYLPQQAVGLYPTSGSSDDWLYGERGIASYTFEIGSSSDGFYPQCNRYDSLIAPNLLAFEYAASVASAPYQLAHGPDVANIQLTPQQGGLDILAGLDETETGGQALSAAEAYLDLPPLAGGQPLALTASDGQFDSSQESAAASLSAAGLTSGRHTLFVRGQDSQGNWGPPRAVFFSVADLRLQTPGPLPALLPGEPLALSYRLENHSPFSVSGIQFSLAFSPSARLLGQPAGLPAGCDLAYGCALPELAAGQALTITLSVQAPPASRSFSASAAAYSSAYPDANPQDNLTRLDLLAAAEFLFRSFLALLP